MSTQDGSARFGPVQMVAGRDAPQPLEVLRTARHVERATIAVAMTALVLWVTAHLAQVAFAVGLIACAATLAGRLVRC